VKHNNVTADIAVTANFAINTFNTPAGSDIEVQPADTTTGATPVKLNFSSVSQPAALRDRASN
jgi:hypothetical protein